MKKTALLFISLFFIAFTANSGTISAQESQIQDEIIYNIVVDRYNNGDFNRNEQVNIEDPNAYHGGDIQGIITKLDTFQELGVTTLSLSPIMENAPAGYHGYWIEDFYSIEEQFGTMEDLHTLIDEAHKRDIKIVLELVSNYISSSHSIVSDPEKADWLLGDANLSTDWADNVAVLNQDNPEVQTFLTEVAEFWMNETDIDGFKLQAVDQSSIDFLETFTAHIKSINPEFYIIGDILNTDEDLKEIKEISGIDMVDNPILQQSMTNTFSELGNPVSDLYEAWEESGSEKDLLYIDNKYTDRFTQVFAENGRNSVTAWSLALTYMYTTPGVPSLFQGSELPMYGDASETQKLVQFNSGDAELTEFHNRISSLRSQFPALVHGDFELVDSSGAMSVFKRTYEDETMFIAINNDEESQAVSVTGIDSGMQLRGYLGDNIVRENDNGEFRISIPRETAEVFSIEPDQGFNWGLIGFVIGVFLLFVVGVIYLTRKQKKREARE
ncbi:alpha-amlyase [Virgibacillus profundi]|uniref:Alpha-amlyase n=1 Tax=Virgibacillus profundi TaxID=2024555 RepID=A0A2A2IB56_9BACI|nr:alpha-amylase family glycosyl hydrolase [Virgibacillus profundi]PAV29231.1 alpha-amlyase [Virgibacillus profundi]PXY53400.1 alpha-amlyase [Virgibacillus profundi]